MRDSNDSNISFYVALAVFIIFAVLGLTYMIQNTNSYDERGTFGDMFGFANALFTGLSVVGLIATVLLQRKDINLQREELKKQTNSIHVQNFENTFFQLLSLFNSITNTMEVTYGDEVYTGRRAIIEMNSTLNLLIEKKAKGNNIMSETMLREAVINLDKVDVMTAYMQFYNLHKEFIAHYFRSFYHIIKLIHLTKDIDKKFYISIARSQLSSIELIFFFYNGVSPRGLRKFRPLINQYGVLKGLDFSLMPNTNLKSEYNNSAFYLA